MLRTGSPLLLRGETGLRVRLGLVLALGRLFLSCPSAGDSPVDRSC
jgi:hypothetical protein